MIIALCYLMAGWLKVAINNCDDEYMGIKKSSGVYIMRYKSGNSTELHRIA